MKKSLYLYSLAAGLAILGLAEAVSGFVLWLALPSGGGRRGLESVFWGLSRHNWLDVHDWVAVALIAIVTVHLALHWKWVFSMSRKIWSQMTQSGHPAEHNCSAAR